MADWKEAFLKRYSELTDIDKFTESSLKPLRKTIRVNTLKTSIQEIKSRFDLKPIPWCKEGFFINKLSVGNTKEHYLGYIYLQGAASMIPPLVLNPRPNDIILDTCASPGSKTTQMAAMIENQGLIIANDSKIDRLKPLTLNLQRCGVTNTIITRMEGHWFKNRFDKILLDAPCSGIGTIRKSYKTIKMWNPQTIKKMSSLQKRLITNSFEILNEGGTLVYSTCTLEPHEDEAVVDYLLKRYDNAKLEKFSLDLKRGSIAEEFEGDVYSSEVKKCLKLWPQDNDTEGFFIAKIRKD